MTMDTERTDPLAATLAEMALHAPLLYWLQRATSGRLPQAPERAMAAEIVARYTAQVERRDGQRRIVLCGPWEIDPGAVTFVPAARSAA